MFYTSVRVPEGPVVCHHVISKPTTTQHVLLRHAYKYMHKKPKPSCPLWNSKSESLYFDNAHVSLKVFLLIMLIGSVLQLLKLNLNTIFLYFTKRKANISMFYTFFTLFLDFFATTPFAALPHKEFFVPIYRLFTQDFSNWKCTNLTSFLLNIQSQQNR